MKTEIETALSLNGDNREIAEEHEDRTEGIHRAEPRKKRVATGAHYERFLGCVRRWRGATPPSLKKPRPMNATRKPSRAEPMDARTRVICESVVFARTVSAFATDSRAASAIVDVGCGCGMSDGRCSGRARA